MKVKDILCCCGFLFVESVLLVNAQTYLNMGTFFPSCIWLPVISARRQQQHHHHDTAHQHRASAAVTAATDRIRAGAEAPVSAATVTEI